MKTGPVIVASAQIWGMSGWELEQLSYLLKYAPSLQQIALKDVA